MKQCFLISLILIATTSFSCKDSSAKNSVLANDKGFAVVELFTSEGCSSCPRADKAVEKLLQKYRDHVYVLGYHVDYWDNLGWKDIFSNPAYTQRQRAYAKSFKIASVYTPQIVVNGTQQFVGSDENKLNDAVITGLQENIPTTINITAKASDDHQIAVDYFTGAVNADINIALIQLQAENKIRHGENSGATLHHVNIVRDIKTVVANPKGTAVLNIPENLSADDCKVIAFIQNADDNKIIAATESYIE